MGKYLKPFKPIEPEDDDQAHIDDAAEFEIEIVQAIGKDGKQEDFMIGKKIKKGEGISHEVIEINQPDPPADGEEEPAPWMPPHIKVEDVTQEPKIKFFKVPNLGMYIVFKMAYDSCLFEEALEESMKDKVEFDQKFKEQEQEKKEWQQEINQQA